MKKRAYDLEDRTNLFAKEVRMFASRLPKTTINIEDIKQVIRSSGSVGANYIEANEALSKKDFIMRIKICRKESKETAYWLDLLVDTNTTEFNQKGISLKTEALELKRIFSSILLNSE